MLKGAYTLLVTPFKNDMSVDEDGLKKLVLRQVDADIHGIAPLGVTGENTLMTDEEVLRVLKIVVDNAHGKCLVVPDTCVMSLWKGLERIKEFAGLGADYIAVFAPYFILPKMDGLIKFYEKLADVSPVPIVLHTSKGRTGIDVTPETIAHLAKHPNIAGIKYGSKEIDLLAKVIYLTKDEDFEVFTGKDTTAFTFVTAGGSGTFTVAGNVIPGAMKDMVDKALAGKTGEAQEIHHRYYELFEAVRFETNPMGAKMALNLMGLPAGPLRLPLTQLSNEKTRVLASILKERDLI
ncbi:MAG: 4-hydroxy-tetrahydrodipicolinate synthase [Bacteroidetes bacterium]|nr:4-hydroxy-tetrahydrodipicolinate synthase [Bacteroidota bacterium]